MTTYSDRTSAVTLQDRFINEARVDIVGRTMNVLEKAPGLPVRMAQEGEPKYFAGLLRAVDNTYCSDIRRLRSTCTTPTKPGNPAFCFQNGLTDIDRTAEAGRLGISLRKSSGTPCSPLSWAGNPSSTTDSGRGRLMTQRSENPLPSYAYSPTGLQGSLSKVITPVEGDLTFPNSRNFHEVKPCDRTVGGPQEVMRLTMSSFVGRGS